jgi:hypothetical protein
MKVFEFEEFSPEIFVKRVEELAGKVRPHISVAGRIQINTGIATAAAAVDDAFRAILEDIARAPHSEELEQVYVQAVGFRAAIQSGFLDTLLTAFGFSAPDGAQPESTDSGTTA